MENELGNRYAEIIVEVPGRWANKPFHYQVPADLQPLAIGSRVLVPFGHRSVYGYVVGYSAPPPGVNIKKIKKIVGTGLNEELMTLARWMTHKYLCNFSDSLHSVLGAGRAVKQTTKRLYPTVDANQVKQLTLTPKQRCVLVKAIDNTGTSKAQLARLAKVSTGTVDALIKKKLLQWSTKTAQQNIPLGEPRRILTPEQQQAVTRIGIDIKNETHKVFLLWGVTGSGKTEVYLETINQVLKQGRQAILLVPEIALTPQMIAAFRTRFGSLVAVLHSKISAGERYAEQLRIEKGEAQVVLGARSAVFAPVPKPGIIILDEEHEPLYKQEESPKYHTRDVAIYRAQYHQGIVVLGSATPALESYCRAEPSGPYQLLTMKNRVGLKPLPAVHIVDMRREMDSGNNSIFSRALLAKISQRIADNQQVMLFINRRGYSTFIVCRRCGLVLKCPHCDISLTYHQDGLLRCHYCNYRQRTPRQCPDCTSDIIGFFGTGTQRVVQEAKEYFPHANILRMDGDTTSRKGAHERILADFRSGQGNILVGTQMIAKGLDIPNVTLVGVISADTTLYMPDFRAAERTFQLLTQVSGRSGRGKNPGETIVQTYNPEHYSITTARDHDYLAFYQREMELRRALKYPPFYYLARILISGEQQEVVEIVTKEIKSMLEHIATGTADQKNDIIIMGPAPAALTRIQNHFRWQMVIKGRTLLAVREVTARGYKGWVQQSTLTRKVNVSLDIEPQFML